jgi:hypothetical protein
MVMTALTRTAAVYGRKHAGTLTSSHMGEMENFVMLNDALTYAEYRSVPAG